MAATALGDASDTIRSMAKWNTVAIVGVGLIGGSIGLALRRRKLAKEVVGIGRRAESLRQALQLGTVTKTTRSLPRGVAQAEVVIVCTPVHLIAEQVEQAAAVCRADALITDAGSTKAEICNRLASSLRQETRFIGSHPLAGSEKAGAAAATADLFVNRTVIVTPTSNTRSADQQAIVDFWTSLGAEVVAKTPEEHDQILAATSHLPHLVASALAAATPAELLRWTASGWSDTTRVAAGDAELWAQIFLANRVHVLGAFRAFQAELTAMGQALEQGSYEQMIKILAQGKQRRDAVGN